jgi:hypothetical protein
MVFFYYPNYDARIPQQTSQQTKQRSIKKFNTLLDGSASASVSFGEYISAKWANVQRSI